MIYTLTGAGYSPKSAGEKLDEKIRKLEKQGKVEVLCEFKLTPVYKKGEFDWYYITQQFKVKSKEKEQDTIISTLTGYGYSPEDAGEELDKKIQKLKENGKIKPLWKPELTVEHQAGEDDLYYLTQQFEVKTKE